MLIRQHRILADIATAILIASLTFACSRDSDCTGPSIDMEKAVAIKKLRGFSGPPAPLLIPNPINATGLTTVLASDPKLVDQAQLFRLPDLTGAILDNSFLRVRVRQVNDSLEGLAKPDSRGVYSFRVGDVHYSEVLAYLLVTAATKYYETLGFSLNKNRPLFTLVRSENGERIDVNAFYEANYFDPQSPRLLRFMGNSSFPVAEDGDAIRHELGHFLLDQTCKEFACDLNGTLGAESEGAAINEGFADYFAATFDGPEIGEWVARNDATIRAGSPIRSAIDKPGDALDFRAVAVADGTGKKPGRYEVGSWLSRALFEIRTQFENEDKKGGAVFADRLMFSAASLLSTNASISEFYRALVTADERLHCGNHTVSIRNAFERRGFDTDISNLSQPLILSQVRARGFIQTGGQYHSAPFQNGTEVRFAFRLENPNLKDARNVRVRVQASSKLIPLIPEQAYGDLASRQSITVGNGVKSMSIDFSISARLDRMSPGEKIPFVLLAQPENGPLTQIRGEISP
ncbi:MAG: hypothetical protein HY537_12135 [Deltaproteobacteria bacterium]|nr:hypothetical protein [Deltaproteobacteria bacterium]